ncbi:MAG: response regulator, partial [Marinicaulis sp.]|nr:response regulator [Marinicaulis sp.]
VGDEVVEIVFHHAASIGNEIKPDDNVTAFRTLNEMWREAHELDDYAPPFTNAALMQSLGEPPSKIQMSLLLHDVLGLGDKEIAEIIAPASNSVTELIVSGRVMHASRADGVVIIIEDEPVIASDLRSIVERLGGYVAGVAAKAEKAVSLIKKHKPDLVLADYNLIGEKTGVDVVAESRDVHDCPVIFVTGFPETVLEGKDIEPDVVIGKPYSHEGIAAAVSHCLSVERPGVRQ